MYGKVFEKMYTGSMLGSGALMFAVWPYVIAHMMPNRDRTVFTVELNTALMALLIGEKEEDIRATVEKCCQPDPKSRTPDKDGRRLIRLGEYLYEVVNGRHYDRIKRAEDLREGNRERQEAYREKQKTAKCSTGNNGQLEHYHPDSRTVLHILNEASGNHYREVDSNLKVISARLNEPDVNLEGIKTMILRQCKRWKGTPQAEYLRPETLFGKTKFDGYYAAKDQPVIEEKHGAKVREEDVPYGERPFNLADSL